MVQTLVLLYNVYEYMMYMQVLELVYRWFAFCAAWCKGTYLNMSNGPAFVLVIHIVHCTLYSTVP